MESRASTQFIGRWSGVLIALLCLAGCSPGAITQPAPTPVELYYVTDRARVEDARRYSEWPSRQVSYAYLVMEAALGKDKPTAKPALSPPVEFPSSTCLFQALPTGDILVFVHGFNNTFLEVVERGALLKALLPFPGPVIVWSWPSPGLGVADYVLLFDLFRGFEPRLQAAYLHDWTTSDWAVEDLATFLQALLEYAGDGKVHLLVAGHYPDLGSAQ